MCSKAFGLFIFQKLQYERQLMWKPYLEKYEINELGECRNGKTGRVLKSKINQRGYKYYTVSVNGKLRDIPAHRAVAELFLHTPRPDQTQVNHIDADKTNSSVDNLEWVTPEVNITHARGLGLLVSKNKRPVAQIKNGRVINTYESLTEAAEALMCNTGGISRAASAVHRSYKGFQWKYLD